MPEAVNTAAEKAMDSAVGAVNGNNGAIGLAFVGGFLLGAAALKAIQLAQEVIASRKHNGFDDYEDESESVTVNPSSEEDDK